MVRSISLVGSRPSFNQFVISYIECVNNSRDIPKNGSPTDGGSTGQLNRRFLDGVLVHRVHPRSPERVRRANANLVSRLGPLVPAISAESPSQYDAIREVVTAAFDGDFEAALVDACRGSDVYDPALSLVATVSGNVVGHACFTPVRIGETSAWDTAVVLAPLAVHPAHQGRGIGSQLVREGLERAAAKGYRVCLLHGDPAFYKQFGFGRADRYGIENPLETPPTEFLAVELGDSGLDGVAGPVHYPPAVGALLR